MNPLNVRQGQLVVMTDLDGTLLDHYDYSPTVALNSIQKLLSHGVPLIFNSSKTFEEQRTLQRDLGIRAPFVFENGSGVAVPAQISPTFVPDYIHKQYYIKQFAPLDLSDISTIMQHGSVTKFQKLLTMSTAEINDIIRHTGLDLTQATLAKARIYTDTILDTLDDEDFKQWASLFDSNGIKMTKGGRFYTVQAKEIDKATPLQWLRSLWNTPIYLIAIGDSENDTSMIAAADEGYWVQRPDNKWAVRQPAHTCNLIPKIGPYGFAHMVQAIFSTGIQ